MITAKIKLKLHLVEYAQAKWPSKTKGIVKFSDNLDITFVINNQLLKKPKKIEESIDVDSNFEFYIPWKRGGKNIRYWNYIDKHGAKEIQDKLENMFWYDVHTFMDIAKYKRGIQFNESAYELIKKWGITGISHDAITRSHRRFRNNLQQMKNCKY